MKPYNCIRIVADSSLLQRLYIPLVPIDSLDIIRLEKSCNPAVFQFQKMFPDRTASWAIRFAASLPNVLTVLSGMSTLAQMEDNLSYMKDFKPMNASEQAAIRKALLEEIPDTTKIIIAQRISSVQDADKIVVMDEGRISAVGDHETLLASSAIYREVYESQTKGSGFHA